MLPKRKSPRASWLDYNDGDYFVTVCTKDKVHYFGEISNEVMRLTAIGSFLQEELRGARNHHPGVRVQCFVVMPNHFHAIVRVSSETQDEMDAPQHVPTREERMTIKVGERNGIANPILTTFMSHLKGAVTRYARQLGQPFAWQARYHDHLIRGTRDGNNIARYIENNVISWSADCFFK